jgi:N-hydroxyarylamine O-acetyltransferase
MYEELYRELDEEQVDLYLKRIGVERKSPDRDYLDELTLAHRLNVPFENLDVVELKKNVSLDVHDVFQKIVTNRRGGYCFEMNLAFFSLLRALGYDVQACLARVVMGGADNGPKLHRVNTVRFGGSRCVSDVGFGGPSPTFSLAVGESRVLDSDLWGLSSTDGEWILWREGERGRERLISLVPFPLDAAAFVTPNHWCCTSDQSVFTRVRMVNMNTRGGNVSITGDTLTVFNGGERTQKRLATHGELDEALLVHFGVTLPID